MEKDCVNSTSTNRAAIWAAAFELIRQSPKIDRKVVRIAQIVDRTPAAVRKWEDNGVPEEHIDILERELGIPGYMINPIIFSKERILRWADNLRAQSNPAT